MTMAKSKSSVAIIGAEEKEWRARSDMRTLSEAEEIRGDKTRHEAAKKCAQEELQKMQSIAASSPKDEAPKMRSAGRESMKSFVEKREGKK